MHGRTMAVLSGSGAHTFFKTDALVVIFLMPHIQRPVLTTSAVPGEVRQAWAGSPLKAPDLVLPCTGAECFTRKGNRTGPLAVPSLIPGMISACRINEKCLLV
ncbi:mCG1035935, isoform CRA_b [Mus musculus]|nr:mCG1035935, isoform CRA_b [Mus musculus]